MQQRHRRRQRGFTYLSLMILLTIIGLVTASAIKLGSVLQRSRAEQELLVIGAAFSDALQSYAEATPAGQPTIPPSLQELLRDPRFPTPRRHLRKIFVDPITGQAEWGVVYAGEKNGVLSIYSLSSAKPVKLSNFPSRFAAFAGMTRISDWKFTGGQKSAESVPASNDAAAMSVASAQRTEKNPAEQPPAAEESAAPEPETTESSTTESTPAPVVEKIYVPLKQDTH